MGLLDYFGKKKATRTVFQATGTKVEKSTPTPVSLKAYLDKDPVLASNLRQLVTAILESDPFIDVKLGKTLDAAKIEKYNDQLEDVEFGEALRNAMYSFIWNGNMFFEVVVMGNKLKELYVIDPETIKIEEDDYGVVTKIIQSQPTGDKELDMDRILHIRMPSLKTGSWGESYIKPLEFTLARKELAEDYLAGMLENLHPLLFIELIESANDDQVRALKNEIRGSRKMNDPVKIISLLGGESVGRVDTGTTENFDVVLRYIDSLNSEIIRILQIPPIVAGTVDNSNRSNSEIQEKAVFGRTINAWQNFLVKKFNKLLFKDKLGWKDVTLEFPSTDTRVQEAALIRALKLKELGFTNDVIWQELNKSGIKVANDFNELPEMETGVEKSEELFDSRQPRDKGGVPQNEKARQTAKDNGMEMKQNG